MANEFKIKNGAIIQKLKPFSDSTSSLIINNATDSSTIFNLDSTNNRISINKLSPAEALDINGYILGSGYKTNGGTSGGFLKADGSVDSVLYVPTSTLNTTFSDNKMITGFINGANTTVAYDWTTRTVTLTGTDLSYYWRGIKHSLGTGTSWTSSAHPATIGPWYLSSSDGTNFTWAQSIWPMTNVLVSFVNYQSTAALSFGIKECHGTMDPESHDIFHNQVGTYISSGGKVTVGSYVFDNAADINTTPGFDAAVVDDEDCETNLAVWPKGTYTTMYVNATTGTSTFNTTSTTPFIATTNTFIQVNNTATGVMTVGVSGRWYNVYQILVPISTDTNSAKFRMIMLQPQATFTSLALAIAEDPRTLNLGSLATQSTEFVILTRLTYATANGNTNIGKVTLPTGGITYITGTKMSQLSVSGLAGTNHSSLTNLTWLNSGHVGGINTIIGFDGNGTATEIETNTIATTGQTFYLGTTQVAINRASNPGLTLNGVTTDGNIPITGGTATGLVTFSAGLTASGGTFSGTTNHIGLATFTGGFTAAGGTVSGNLNVLTGLTVNGYSAVTGVRKLTINGTQYDLSSDRSWSVGTVTSVSAGSGLTSSGTATDPTISHSSVSTTSNTSTASPAVGGTFTAIDSITTSNGHITAVNTKTITLPSDTDTLYTFATGATNGAFEVKASTGSTQSISIYGLGSNAYNSTSYLPLAGGTLSGTLNMSGTNPVMFGSVAVQSVYQGELCIRTDLIRLGLQASGWNYDQWAGFKYDDNVKTIYLGGARADGSIWANNSGNLNETTIKFIGIGTGGVQINGKKIWHEGNFTPSIYLTTSGASSTYATITNFNSHTGNTSNPHSTTASQVGAYTTGQTNSLLTGYTKTPISVTYDQLVTLKNNSQLVPLQTYLLNDYRTTYQMKTDYFYDYYSNAIQNLEPMGGLVGTTSNVYNVGGSVMEVTLDSPGSGYSDGTYTIDGGNYDCQIEITTNNGAVVSVTLVYGGNMYSGEGIAIIQGGDYNATVHYSVGFMEYTVSGNVNPIEPLIITATGVNTLDPLCKSTLYGQDDVYYNIDDNTEGFSKGKIYRRIDKILNNDIGTDWRFIKYRRYKLNVTNTWVNGTVYGIGDIVNNNGDICYCYKTNDAWDGGFYNFIRIGFINGQYAGMYYYDGTYGNIYCGIVIFCPTFNQYLCVPSNPSIYSDTLMFTTYDTSIYNNKIETYYIHNTVIIGNNFYYNTVGYGFNYNTVGNNFNSNTVDNNFCYNTVGNGFNYNTVGNSFNYNTVGNGFNSNTVDNNFYSNTVGNGFCFNTVFENINNINLTSISELYNKTYGHILTELPNSKVKIEWTDTYGDINIIRT